ncbi:hypothetical protein, partial [Streptomyces albogriseolus]
MSLQEDARRPLSGAQEGLWYAGRLAPDSAAYNTAEAVADPHPPAPSAHTAPAGDAASADRSAPSPGAPA